MTVMIKKALLFSLLVVSFFNLSAQSDSTTIRHEHHKNEIGMAHAPVYYVKEDEVSYGLHLHYVRNIKNTKFGIGFGYEKIFDDHQHQTIGLVGGYRATENLNFNIAPGITFERSAHEEEGHTEAAFALHLETSYEFEVQDFHIGPVLEIAYDPNDYHIALGVHIGYGF